MSDDREIEKKAAADLAFLSQAWPNLTPDMRARIMAIMEEAGPFPILVLVPGEDGKLSLRVENLSYAESASLASFDEADKLKEIVPDVENLTRISG